MLFSSSQQTPESEFKRAEQAARINALPSPYHEPITKEEHSILATPTSELVSNIKSGSWKSTDVLRAYGKQALLAQKITNCLTEIMIADAETWASEIDHNDEKRKRSPLAGVPISMKDTANVKGYDSCIGYSALVNHPASRHSPLVQLLLDAGAIPFVKTNVPITLLSFESNNPIWGRALNPYAPAHTPGGSSGGEGALIACGGSRIGIGTDVAGSVRAPAHYCGIYTIRASAGRFPRSGNTTSLAGQEGVPAVYSPMAKILDDLETVWRGVCSMKPWEYDHSVIPLPWREVTLEKKLRFGVMWDDGVVPPSPACLRALETVVTSLKSAGHQVVDFVPPSPYRALQIGSQLLLEDGCHTATKNLRSNEANDPGVGHFLRWHNLPSPLKYSYLWYTRYIKQDRIYAGLLEGLWGSKTAEEHWSLVAQREAYRTEFAEKWKEEGIDFLLTVPNALPALPHDEVKHGFKTCGYTFLFNVLDYTAGVFPVTKVDPKVDAVHPLRLAEVKGLNRIAQQAYEIYDAETMEGLPVGVQIAGQKLEEEKVLAGMKIVERAMEALGVGFKP